MIEFLDLRRINAAHEPAIRAAADRVLASGWYVLGAENEAFEAEFAAYCEAPHCVAVANGLDALHLVLRAPAVTAAPAAAAESRWRQQARAEALR